MEKEDAPNWYWIAGVIAEILSFVTLSFTDNCGSRAWLLLSIPLLILALVFCLVFTVKKFSLFPAGTLVGLFLLGAWIAMAVSFLKKDCVATKINTEQTKIVRLHLSRSNLS